MSTIKMGLEGLRSIAQTWPKTSNIVRSFHQEYSHGRISRPGTQRRSTRFSSNSSRRWKAMQDSEYRKVQAFVDERFRENDRKQTAAKERRISLGQEEG